MAHGLPQCLGIAIDALMNIRIRTRTGFRQPLDSDFAPRAPRMTSGAIGHAVAGVGHQPRKEGALRIAGRAGYVKGKQYLLDNIFDSRRLKKAASSPPNLPQKGTYLPQQPRNSRSV